MDSLKDHAINCHTCVGTCCTFQSNSMKITPIEAIDLIQFLKEKNRINNSLLDTLKTTVKEFRLNYSLSTGRNGLLRRTYTCPFFKGCEKGCSIDPEYKPYGCLAFNPNESGITNGMNCRSDPDLLEKREINNSEENAINQEIIKRYHLHWQKESIPQALLDLLNKTNFIR